MTEQNHVVLEVKNIHKRFGEKVVHRGVDFTLYEGEVLGLLGGSGSGKSVILRSIIGLEKPEQGHVMFEGQDLTTLSEENLYKIRTQIGYVFQGGALFDSLTVEENIAYLLNEHTDLSDSEIRKKVNEMLEKVDMKGSNQLLPAALSGGMQKRAGLARATILNPKVTLFDEPTAGLDPSNTKRLVENLLALKKDGMTGIFVTHDIPAAIALCDRIAVLYKGKIHAIGPTQEIKNSDDPVVKPFFDDL
jgi:phospholipid/cholesterol/gamma-HCH transport system ATP-binding protein